MHLKDSDGMTDIVDPDQIVLDEQSDLSMHCCSDISVVLFISLDTLLTHNTRTPWEGP